MSKMSERAIMFAANHDLFCKTPNSFINVIFDDTNESWDDAVETILICACDDVYAHMGVTGDTIDDVKRKIESKLCAAAEEWNPQPEIFPF